MLVFLNGIDNRSGAVNENYARELMELFTLGADRGAYTETDVRELARALTGWRADWIDTEGLHNFRFDADALGHRHQDRVRPARAPSRGRTRARWSIEHPLHASFFVRKLWSYFIPTPPRRRRRRPRSSAPTSSSGHQIRPVLEAILRSPQLYEGPRMVKPPVVQLAGMLRALGRARSPARSGCGWPTAPASGSTTRPTSRAGTTSAGWTPTRSARRWDLVNYVVSGRTIDPSSAAGASYPAETAEQALAAARAFWLDPRLEPETAAWLLAYAGSSSRPPTREHLASTREQRARCAPSARTPCVT